MNDAIRELIEFVKRHDDISTEQAIEAYFSRIVWLLELDEWQRLSREERRRFIQQRFSRKFNRHENIRKHGRQPIMRIAE